jgi:hypothetical protein
MPPDRCNRASSTRKTPLWPRTSWLSDYYEGTQTRSANLRCRNSNNCTEGRGTHRSQSTSSLSERWNLLPGVLNGHYMTVSFSPRCSGIDGSLLASRFVPRHGIFQRGSHLRPRSVTVASERRRLVTSYKRLVSKVTAHGAAYQRAARAAIVGHPLWRGQTLTTNVYRQVFGVFFRIARSPGIQLAR